MSLYSTFARSEFPVVEANPFANIHAVMNRSPPYKMRGCLVCSTSYAEGSRAYCEKTHSFGRNWSFLRHALVCSIL